MRGGQIPDLFSQRANALSPACTRLEEGTSLNQSESDPGGPNNLSVLCFARSSSNGNAGSIGRSSAACLSWFNICCGCFISRMDIGEPQCAQAESVARLIAAPQL